MPRGKPKAHPVENGWGEWKNAVLSNLDELKRGQDSHAKDLNDFKLSVTEKLAGSADHKRAVEALSSDLKQFQLKTVAHVSALKVKSSAWGLVGGLLVGIPILIAVWKLVSPHP